ncbi:MAG: SDR family oxidoreductase [Pseudomonadota bacterium]
MNLVNKVALITGASRGIGASAARSFADAGFRVALLSRSTDALETLVDEIGDAAVSIPCDVADYAQVDAAVSTCVARFGGINVVVNNAGVIEPISHLAQADPLEWGRVIDINLKGVFHCMRAALPVMLEAGGGTILTISSGAAHGPTEAWSHYNASKAGAAMLTRCIDHEYGPRGIRAMGLSPGTVATQMQREIKASGINRVSRLAWSDHIPPEWPAAALVWMATPAADAYIGKEISLRDESLLAQLGLVAP